MPQCTANVAFGVIQRHAGSARAMSVHAPNSRQVNGARLPGGRSSLRSPTLAAVAFYCALGWAKVPPVNPD
jgi:hypothetical protein